MPHEQVQWVLTLEGNPIGNLSEQLKSTDSQRSFTWMPVFGRLGWDRWGTKRLLESLAETALVDSLIKAGFGGGSRDSFAVYVEHLRRNISNLHWH